METVVRKGEGKGFREGFCGGGGFGGTVCFSRDFIYGFPGTSCMVFPGLHVGPSPDVF